MPVLKYRYSILTGIWLLVIFIESSLPGDPLKLPPFPHFDKLIHFTAYAILGLLLAVSLHREWKFGLGVKLFWVSLALGSFYGVTDEFHQSFVLFRSCDVLDWLADTAGTAFGAWGYVLILLSHREPISK